MADNYLEKKFEDMRARAQAKEAREQRERQRAWKKRMEAYRKRLEEEQNGALHSVTSEYSEE